uniref:Uncharacterized protein n=1 Tax=Timema genevievae TaxID=629358 RepID=A0A7R9PQV4_TIMGE|nr:unnamed protein product [Timema genevievae]
MKCGAAQAVERVLAQSVQVRRKGARAEQNTSGWSTEPTQDVLIAIPAARPFLSQHVIPTRSRKSGGSYIADFTLRPDEFR